MLKKVLASVLSISVIGSTLVVPAFADFKTEEITTSLVNETFTELTVPAYMTAKTEYKLGDNVFLTSVLPENSIRTIEDGKFKTNITKRNDANTNPYAAISVRPTAEQTLTEGDKIHINFDFVGQNGDDTLNLGMYLNGNFDEASYKRFVGLNESYDKNTKDTYGWAGSKMLSWLCGKDNKIRLGTSLVEKAKDADLSKGMNVDIVLNPYDSAQGNEQTVQLTYKYKTSNNEEKSVVFYAKYDADYRGDSTDTTFDKITSFKGLTLETNQPMVGTYTVDNVVIEKLRDDKTYYTSTVKNLIDYNFKNIEFSNPTNDKVKADRFSPVDKKNNVWYNRDSMNHVSAEVVNDTVKGNVFKQIVHSGWDEHTSRLVFVNPEGTTNLNNGDIVRFSFDAKFIAEPNSGKNFNGNENLYGFGPQINLASKETNIYLDEVSTDVKLQTNENIENWAVGTDKENTKVSASVITWKPQKDFYFRDVMLTKQDLVGKTTFGSRTDESTEGMKAIQPTVSKWHSYEYIINTADPAKDGKQTMKVYVDKGTDNEMILYNTLDLNVMNETEDKLTKFTGLSMVINGQWDGTPKTIELYSTNYKLDVIKPGIGLSGDAIKDHDPEAAGGIKLEEGDLKIDVNLNVPGTVKKSTEEAGTGTVASIYVAQYDENGLLKDINVLTTESGEFTQSNASISRTIQVKSGVEQVKIFGFDGALRPIFTNVVGGVVKVNPQNISFNSENGVDSSQH